MSNALILKELKQKVLLQKLAGRYGDFFGPALPAAVASSTDEAFIPARSRTIDLGNGGLAVVPGPLQLANNLASMGGSIYGLASTPPTAEEIKNMHGAMSMVPGVGPYRQAAIAKRVGADYEAANPGKNSNFWPELIGSGTGVLTGAAGGGLLGSALGAGVSAAAGDSVYDDTTGAFTPPDIGKGAFIGGMAGTAVGAISPTIIAALAALVSSTRTKQEQDAAEEIPNATNLMMPGSGIYNNLKRLGYGYKTYQEDPLAKAGK